MRETASTIKTEVLAELNVTRKRLHQIADFIGCNTLTSQVSSYRSTFMACAKCLNAVKVNRTLLCKRESMTADVADLVPICTPSAKETLGMRRPRKEVASEVGVSTSPQHLSFSVLPVVLYLSQSCAH